MILSKPDYQEAIDLIQTSLDQNNYSKEQVKELRWRKAGLIAEKQMAFLLESYFEKYDDVLVINNLKVTHGTGAQIDHLLLTTQGMFLIESKSVSGSLFVDEYGDWSRDYKGHKTAMKSPVNQVKRQQEVLFDFIDENKGCFRIKVANFQFKMGAYIRTHYVAVSENGTISGARDQFKDVVMKADHLPEVIKRELPEKGLRGLLSMKDKDCKMLIMKELKALGTFLIESNTAISPFEEIRGILVSWSNNLETAKKIPDNSEAPVGPEVLDISVEISSKIKLVHDFECSKCSSQNIVATAGRYGAYFKCSDCGGNTPIKESCSQCNQAMKVSFKENKFRLICEPCGIEKVIQENGQFVTEQVNAVKGQKQGHCIRCGVDIDFNVEAPYCKKCYFSWNRYKNVNYTEKYCHETGVEATTSMSKPVMK